ncbi:hypothetical protein [Acrocarpospora phusangensis]|uniref:hypothetical protein n=1 Tax=Acrocarpospora phusangensis TaxID=1070424 RepID=UPI00194DFA69|nr:hypothetical protein [Acrocarpospora phusangensis]
MRDIQNSVNIRGVAVMFLEHPRIIAIGGERGTGLTRGVAPAVGRRPESKISLSHEGRLYRRNAEFVISGTNSIFIAYEVRLDRNVVVPYK